MSPRLDVVLHHRFPRGVDQALREVDSVRVVEPSSDDEVVDALKRTGVLVTYQWDDRFLVPGLRWIQSISAGVDQFPVDRLAAADVVLTSARGVHAVPVAEHAFALLLALTRGVGFAMRNAGSRRWQPVTGRELSGATLGVLGLGVIGEEIARRGSVWGMRVIGTKANPIGYRGVASEVYGPDGTTAVFEGADAVVAALPDIPATRGLVDRGLLARLGGGWFVNVGRGSAVVEEDLIWALDEGGLLGAGLDVFAEEPLPPGSPLWDHSRVVLTPHVAGLSPAYGPRLAEIFGANVSALLGEAPWVNRMV